MITELYIENYRLDITDDISALMTFAIDDIKDFGSRSTTWSKTIVLPGTQNNNRIFGSIFQVGHANSYNSGYPNANFNFNASVSANVIIFQDRMQTFRGILRLMEVDYTNGLWGQIEYEVSVFGNLVNLNAALTGKLLENIDFSIYDHIYNDTNIVQSWDNPGGSGIFYPLIDYGTYSTDKHDWDIHTFRPGLYAREYIDKIFSGANYRYDAPLFDTPRFKSLIIPHNKKILTTNQSNLVDGNNYSRGILNGVPITQDYGQPPTEGLTWTAGTPPNDGILLNWTFSKGSGFTTTDGKVYKYQGTSTTNIQITFSISGSFGTSAGSPFTTYCELYLNLWKNGEGNTLVGRWTQPNFSWPNRQNFNFGTNVTVTISVAPNDTLEFRWTQGNFAGILITDVKTIGGNFNIKSANGTVGVPILFGDTVKMNDQIPQNIRQIDFLVWIVRLFNLYVLEDKNDPYLIHITPYVDFYSKNTANSIDWTYKLNRKKKISVKPMSELNAKIYNFKFKSDSDYYNDLYRKRYNEGYGDRIYDSQSEFIQTSQDIEIGFSSTPLVGYGGEEKIYPTIFKRTGTDNDPKEENTDSNIRILQTKKITGIPSWNIKNNETIINTQTQYGYAGHLNDPDAPSDDINFGAPKELFFILLTGNLSNNQFNIYWSPYMAEVTDKDSKLLTASFWLNPKDIIALDFSKYIYLEGIAYRLNAIRNYNATKPDDCIVELLKINFTDYTESAANSGPPNGCFLLWSDEQTLDYDTSLPLVYSDCTNPGDGDTTGGGAGSGGSGGSGGGVTPPPPPPTIFYLNWSFTRTAIFGTLKIYQNSGLQGFATSNKTGSFVINSGDAIEIDISGTFGKPKRIQITNDIDGVIYDNTTTLVTNTHTITILANRNYNIIATASN
jgi:hypothetical protein